jgi:RNA recognition motif-containing protein
MKLYVGNLPFSTTETDVRTLFEQAGSVDNCELVSDRITGRSRGFAFVEMTSSEEGAEAIQRFNDHEIDGRRMVVNEARPREARGGFAGAPGGFRGASRGGPGGGNGGGNVGGFGEGFSAPGANRGAGGGGAGFGARRKSGKGSRRNARSAKRDRKACW